MPYLAKNSTPGVSEHKSSSNSSSSNNSNMRVKRVHGSSNSGGVVMILGGDHRRRNLSSSPIAGLSRNKESIMVQKDETELSSSTGPTDTAATTTTSATNTSSPPPSSAHSKIKSMMITPSPYHHNAAPSTPGASSFGAPAPPSLTNGPVMSIFGGHRLYASPIRVKRKSPPRIVSADSHGSQDEQQYHLSHHNDNNGGGGAGSPASMRSLNQLPKPTNLKYHDQASPSSSTWSTSPRSLHGALASGCPTVLSASFSGESPEQIHKRSMTEDSSDEESSKRLKLSSSSLSSPGQEQLHYHHSVGVSPQASGRLQYDPPHHLYSMEPPTVEPTISAKSTRTTSGTARGMKKPLISPSSSKDKMEQRHDVAESVLHRTSGEPVVGSYPPNTLSSYPPPPPQYQHQHHYPYPHPHPGAAYGAPHPHHAHYPPMPPPPPPPPTSSSSLGHPPPPPPYGMYSAGGYPPPGAYPYYSHPMTAAGAPGLPNHYRPYRHHHNHNRGGHGPAPPPHHPHHLYAYHQDHRQHHGPPGAPPVVASSSSLLLSSSSKVLSRDKYSATADGASSDASSACSSSVQSSTIKSVSEWQHAARTTGKIPNAHRCVPLQEPIPSKFWGEAEKTKDAILADFHRLVNFPDYLAKPRSATGGATSASDPASANGTRNCVMCGKVRICSATSLVRGRALPPKDGAAADDATHGTRSTTEPDDADCEGGTSHIIPRQNKGLCTACDVIVWVVVDDKLEIKWCKGCKNFRPWAAFGDKGSATKCVRCRDRQREKYALQKDEVRSRRTVPLSAEELEGRSRTATPTNADHVPPSSSPSKTAVPGLNEDDDHHLDAARGLRNLMKAATSA